MSTGSISRFVLSHKLMVAIAWVVLFAVGIGLMPQALGQLSENFDMPGTESSDANGALLRNYGGTGGISDPLVPVVTLPEGTTVDSPGVKAELEAAYGKIEQVAPYSRIASWITTGDDAFLSEDRRTVFALVFLPTEGESVAGLDQIEAAMSGVTVQGEPVRITGRPALTAAGEQSEQDSSVLLETLISACGAFIILLYIFGSALALLPLVIAAFSIITTFLVIGGVASFTDINSVVQYMVALIGLGIAIDYALLVVTRWREEHAAGYDNELAVQRAMETAGHAVVFSGTTVGIGLIAMIVLPVPFMRGMGIGGLLIPVVSVIATLTLLPIILATVGPKLDWPRFRRGKGETHGGWHRWSELIVSRRWAAAIVSLAILVALLVPALDLTTGDPKPDALNGPDIAQAGLDSLEASGIGAGVMDPIEIVVQGDAAPVASALAGIDGVRGSLAPAYPHAAPDAPGLVLVIPQSDGAWDDQHDLIERVRETAHAQAGNPLVAGPASVSVDFSSDVYGNFIWMVLAIAVVTYILLVRAFRSIILPLKALAMNVLSVGAAYGVLVLVWQHGFGSDLVWGIPATGSITDWVPMMVFAFLFGLSMDYEVFILARMREEYDAHKDTDRAVVRGLSLTGRLVTCAALILFLAFASMASVPTTELKIMATGLAAGILIDATIIRALLVPALVSLMGHWNWWLPAWLVRFVPHPEPLSDTTSEPARSVNEPLAV
jgi:RND superfamily putative drug exporter